MSGRELVRLLGMRQKTLPLIQLYALALLRPGSANRASWEELRTDCSAIEEDRLRTALHALRSKELVKIGADGSFNLTSDAKQRFWDDCLQIITNALDLILHRLGMNGACFESYPWDLLDRNPEPLKLWDAAFLHVSFAVWLFKTHRAEVDGVGENLEYLSEATGASTESVFMRIAQGGGGFLRHAIAQAAYLATSNRDLVLEKVGRITFAPIGEHRPFYSEFLKDPDVMRHSATGPMRDDQIEAYLEQNIRHVQRLGYGRQTILLDGVPIGLGGLVLYTIEGERVVEISIRLLPAFWRRGIAKACVAHWIDLGFNLFRRPSLCAMVEPNNHASIALFVSCGFAYEKQVTLGNKLLSFYRLTSKGA